MGGGLNRSRSGSFVAPLMISTLLHQSRYAMRIIGGRLQRQTLRSPQGHLTRPTTDRAREAIFNMIFSRLDLHDTFVLDLFAGTGALGLEAISRGAAHATFVESAPKVLSFAQQNAEALEVADQTAMVKTKAAPYLQKYSGPPFSVIFADPPYAYNGLADLPDLALPHLTPNGLLILEHDTRIFFDDHPALDTSRKYGRTVVTIFCPLLAERADPAPSDASPAS